SDLDRQELASSLELLARRASHLMNFVERYRATLEVPEPDPQPVPLAEFASDLVRISQAGMARTTVQLSVEPPDLTAMMDRELMEQALINLLKNAMEAANEVPSPVIQLRFGEDDNALVIQVIDNGPGLPVERDLLF